MELLLDGHMVESMRSFLEIFTESPKKPVKEDPRWKVRVTP